MHTEIFYHLQQVVWPTPDNLEKYSLYLMPCEASFSLTEGAVKLFEGQTLDLCTYYNTFSHRKWLDVAGVKHVGLEIEGTGNVKLKILAWSPTGAATLHHECDLALSQEGTQTDFIDVSSIHGYSLSIEISAISGEASINSIKWGTNQAPRRDVRLKVVVTTFNRIDAIKKTIEKFSKKIFPYVGTNTELMIINNGEDFIAPPHPNITILKNKNLGGAGGFTRGLMETIDENRWTHCLFMDDDASCEAESIYRVIKLLNHALDPRTAISGSMFLSDRPTIQYEKGAVFSKTNPNEPLWQALGSGRDLADRAAVVSNDTPDIANYGAWWFFCFPIPQVRSLAFPFFVRGDDVDFSLSNDFSISTMNGVACWSENFGYKLTPTTEYLTWRSWPALAFLHSDERVIRKALKEAIIASIKMGLRFDYGGMLAAQQGVRHCLLGPSYFGSNPTPVPFLKDIRALDTSTKAPSAAVANSLPVPFRRFSRLRTLASIVTLGGHLLPDFMLRPEPRHTRIAWECGVSGMFRAKTSIFGEGCALKMNKMQRKIFLSGLLSAIRLYIYCVVKQRAVHQEYQRDAMKYKNPSYWLSVLK